MWRSLVAHLVRDEGVAGSNPATPTSSAAKTPDMPQAQGALFFRGFAEAAFRAKYLPLHPLPHLGSMRRPEQTRHAASACPAQ